MRFTALFFSKLTPRFKHFLGIFKKTSAGNPLTLEYQQQRSSLKKQNCGFYLITTLFTQARTKMSHPITKDPTFMT